MRGQQPWFKFWAADYLMDPDVDELTLEAQGLLIRMWCVISQQGNIPGAPEEIARLTRCKLKDVLRCHPQCRRFFKLRNGLLYSERMEQEKKKSELARTNAKKRYEPQSHPTNDANGSTDGNAKCFAQKARRQESQSAEGPSPGGGSVATHDRAQLESTPGGSLEALCDRMGASRDAGENVSSDPLGEPDHPQMQTQKQPQEKSNPNSTASGDELMAATWLLEEAGLASGPYDVQMVSQVIHFITRDSPCSVQDAAEMLLKAAQEAAGRGEIVNVFWFKDRKYAKGANDGTNRPSKSKQRVNDNRRAIAEALAKRGIAGPWDHAEPNSQAIPKPGYDGFDGGIPERPRAVSGEVLPPERGGRGRCAAD